MDAPEPTITLTRKQLLALGMSETLVDLLHFSNAQSNAQSNQPAQSVDRSWPADQIQQKASPQNAAKAIISNPNTTRNRCAAELNQTGDLSEPAFKKRKQEEPEEPEVKLNDLPELPFELILSYLSLEERIKARAVSRRWCKMIDSLRVKRFCYSQLQSGRICGKSRWVRDAFAQNFISSPRFESFFKRFGQSILFNLKHLRLCDFYLTPCNGASVFAPTLNSFARLEKLDIIGVDYPVHGLDRQLELRLNLPMLTSIHLQQFRGVNKLTLNAMNLQDLHLLGCDSLRLNLVHTESVERLITDRMENTPIKKLTNLNYLDIGDPQAIDPTFLDSLAQLKEINVDRFNVTSIFEQKKRYGRFDLKIYLYGLLLNTADELAIDLASNVSFEDRIFRNLVENPSKAADQTAFYWEINYSTIQQIPALDVNLLNRYTDLTAIIVSSPVEDIERFLAILKNSDNIVELEFSNDYSQALFDRLPDHCALQDLMLFNLDPAGSGRLPDLGFVFRLRDLICISVDWPIDISFVRKAFQDLPFLWSFAFKYLDKFVKIEIVYKNHFEVSVDRKSTNAPDLNAALQFVVEKAMEPKEVEVEQEALWNIMEHEVVERLEEPVV